MNLTSEESRRDMAIGNYSGTNLNMIHLQASMATNLSGTVRQREELNARQGGRHVFY